MEHIETDEERDLRYEYERQSRERKVRDEVQVAVRALSSIANRSHDPKVFVEEMSYEHRTLQQSMTGLMLEWFKHLSTLNENQYDLRNEAAVRIAKKVIDATDGITRLPLI